MIKTQHEQSSNNDNIKEMKRREAERLRERGRENKAYLVPIRALVCTLTTPIE